jgi:hypothetical protein
MGLLFALQPRPELSTPNSLRLRSHFRKFAMGGSFLFFAMFMGVMALAAAPLFKLMRQEGGFFDQIIVWFFCLILVIYPIFAFLCFSFEEHAIFSKRSDGFFDLQTYKTIAFIKWGEKKLERFRLDDLTEENWIGKVNAASLKASQAGKKDRYATKGHWLLTLKSADQKITIERRARLEEIQWLKFLIEKHFN